MQQLRTRSLGKALIHFALIAFVLYSIMPFLWAVLGSVKSERDTLSREPRFVPNIMIEQPVLVAGVLGVLTFAVLAWNLRGAGTATGLRAQLPAFALGLLVFGFVLLVPSITPERQIFTPIWDNYRTLWLNSDPADFVPVAIGLVVLVAVLVLVGVNAHRLPVSRAYIYAGIVAIVVLTVLLLPEFARMAEFYDFFLNSVIVTVGTVIVSITIGCLAGYGLARYSGVEGVVILFVALAFRALPRLAFVLPYFSFAQATGLYDTYFLLIITFVAVNQPFTIWLLRSFFADIPRELEEAAMIDGCSRLGAFVRVIIPIVWPGIITTALFTVLLAYNEFLMARVLTSTNWTLPVGIARFTSGEDTRYIPLSNASAVSITIPIVFIIIFFQRYLVKGLAGGAVKG
jgi:multiple sugar transport system permease protein